MNHSARGITFMFTFIESCDVALIEIAGCAEFMIEGLETGLEVAGHLVAGAAAAKVGIEGWRVEGLAEDHPDGGVFEGEPGADAGEFVGAEDDDGDDWS